MQISREKYLKQVAAELKDAGIEATDEQIAAIAEKRVRKEIKQGIQTIQYQVITLMTTNGQAPFITVYMYLNEAKDEQTKADLALMIEETLNQRIKGVQNEKGVWITPAFPKLIYVLEEDNIHEGDKYWYLTELAAKCTAKRMVPDYISEKKMLEYKGDVYPCMGCVDEDEIVTYKLNGSLYVESFARMWKRLSNYFEIKLQPDGKNYYMDTEGVEIYDQKDGFVKNYRVIKNESDNWLSLKFNNGRSLLCTTDHPFETENRGMVLAQDLTENDIISIDQNFAITDDDIHFNPNRAWLMGFLICDATYCDNIIASIAAEGEDDVEDAFRDIMQKEYGLNVNTIDRHRGFKGNYKDLVVISDGSGNLIALKNQLIGMFEGKAKNDRHIPNEVFSWSRESRLSFLAGMIDADGYLNDETSITCVQIGSTNKELALQQMLLAQSLGMRASVYLNHYRSNKKDAIRYRVEFTPCEELLQYLHCEKKRSHFGNTERKNNSIKTTNVAFLVEKVILDRKAYSYDVSTESEHFTVSGIWSHNCRSFLTPDRFTDAGVGNIANAGNYKEGEHKYYGRLTYTGRR